uniref:DUF1499 domain-containing protein n=1 Tax=uncultured Armatimonadetes bacterium TaxID=157466 RepID=A0A6J4JXI8_9BACT|nr:hypothetical protein AVDCRST_MAG63-4270 [uncultured Armatimonadetes bacterium]
MRRLSRYARAALALLALCAFIPLILPRPWRTTNDVTTGRSREYPDLQDRHYAAPLRETLAAAEAAARDIRRWRVVRTDTTAHTLHVEIRTAIPLFTDELTARVAPEGPGHRHSRVNIRSRSRIGRGDLGENARHIRALQRAMDARLPRMTSP